MLAGMKGSKIQGASYIGVVAVTVCSNWVAVRVLHLLPCMFIYCALS
jgi:hypothetical protein